jgi:integrase/recombinase XerD
VTISEAFSRYCLEEITLQNGSQKTVRNYISACRSLVKTTDDIPIQLLVVEHVTRWQQQRGYLGHSSSTVAHDLSRLRQVLKFLKKRGMNVLDYDFVTRPKITKKHPVYLIPQEVQQIIGVIEKKRDKAIFACMFDSGARVSELLNLNCEDLRDNTAQIIGKGGKPGTLHFSPWSMNYLQDYLDSRRDRLTPLFVSAQCRRITVSRVQQLLHIYSDMAGIKKNVTPHILRHSFATDLKRNGADIFDIKEQLRHERISSTEIYVHIEEHQKAQVYARFHTTLNAASDKGQTPPARGESRRVGEQQ